MKYLKGLFLTALAVLFCHVASAQPVIVQSVLPAALLTVSNASATAITATPIAVRGGVRDLQIWNFAQGSGTGTSNVVVSFNLSSDGTNYTTSYPLATTAIACNGSTAVGNSTYINRSNLVGVLYIRPDKIVTAQPNAVTNTVFVSFDP